APCSLVWLSPDEAWILSFRTGSKPTIEHVSPGWHAITHRELDDWDDPRVAWALGQLARWRPDSRVEAEGRVKVMLASHGSEDAPGARTVLEGLAGQPSEPGVKSERLAEARKRFSEAIAAAYKSEGGPAFCIHDGRAQTVSSAIVWLTPWELS